MGASPETRGVHADKPYRVELRIPEQRGYLAHDTTRGVGHGQIGRAHAELQSRGHLVCRLLLEKKKTQADLNKDDYAGAGGLTLVYYIIGAEVIFSVADR